MCASVIMHNSHVFLRRANTECPGSPTLPSGGSDVREVYSSSHRDIGLHRTGRVVPSPATIQPGAHTIPTENTRSQCSRCNAWRAPCVSRRLSACARRAGRASACPPPCSPPHATARLSSVVIDVPSTDPPPRRCPRRLRRSLEMSGGWRTFDVLSVGRRRSRYHKCVSPSSTVWGLTLGLCDIEIHLA